MTQSVVFVFACIAVLAGCSPQGGKPIPRLIEIASPAPGTPESVNAAKFDECAGNIPGSKGKTAVYDPIATYNIARQLPITLDKNNPIQESVRVYIYKYETQVFFQRRDAELFCIYQLKDGILRYMTHFTQIQGRGVLRSQINDKLDVIYSKITGEKINR